MWHTRTRSHAPVCRPTHPKKEGNAFIFSATFIFIGSHPHQSPQSHCLLDFAADAIESMSTLWPAKWKKREEWEGWPKKGPPPRFHEAHDLLLLLLLKARATTRTL
jgi:hypothetical protein